MFKITKILCNVNVITYGPKDFTDMLLVTNYEVIDAIKIIGKVKMYNTYCGYGINEGDHDGLYKLEQYEDSNDLITGDFNTATWCITLKQYLEFMGKLDI